MSEVDGSIYNSKGFDPDDLNAFKTSKKGIAKYPKAEKSWSDDSAMY